MKVFRAPNPWVSAVVVTALASTTLVLLDHQLPARIGVACALVLAAVLCVQRARSVPAERSTWIPLAVGVVVVGAGAVYRGVRIALDLGGSWTLVSTLFTLVAFPSLYSALVHWNRGRRLMARRHEAWSGASAGALVVAGLEVWSLHGGPLAGLGLLDRVNLEIPAALFGVLLLAAVAGPLSSAWRTDSRSWLVVGFVGVLGIPYWARALALPDLSWTPILMGASAVLLALAAVSPPVEVPAGHWDGALAAGESLVLLLGCVAVLSVHHLADSTLVSALTAFTTVVSGVRLLQCLRGLTHLAEARAQASTDELTGTANRRELLRRIEEVTGRGDQVCLAVLDVDDFGTINDGLGNRGGDQLLVEVAHRIQGVLKTTCVLGRLGGDDFAVVASSPPGEPPTDPAELGPRLATALAESFTIAGLQLHLTASIGLAEGTTTDGELLFMRAETALRESKKLRSGPVLHDPARHGDTTGQLRMVEELRMALVRDELVLFFQPQVDVRTGGLDGVEALVRWQHPERGMLGPFAFIPLAETHGLIGPLTERVLELAIAQVESWRDQGVHTRMSVNLSASNLLDEALPERVLARLLAHRVDPADLTLEVTENVFAGDSAQVKTVLFALAALGLDVSIDDYGTGWSSLGYLRQLPVDELKLDRSFTMDLRADPRTAAIVGSTIDLAHRLGMRVVAEGVEDEETCLELRELGCDLTQGYWHAKPMPAAELPGWLAARQADRERLTLG